MTQFVSPWPAPRRLAWILLFWAIFGWAVIVTPGDGELREPMPYTGTLEL